MIEIFGGNVKDYPGAKRRFPGKRKREVTVSVRMYYGIGKHYWVSVKEKDNPIWDGEHWRTCWDDFEGRGRIESQSFLSMVSAQQWLESLKKKEFPKKTHKWMPIDFSGITEVDEKNWLGILKEGD